VSLPQESRSPREPLAKRLLWMPVNFLQAVATGAWTAGWITVALIASAVRGRPDPGLALARRVWAPGILFIGGNLQLEIAGRERLEPSRTYFFAANHQSWVDIPALFVALRRPVLFLAKRELGQVPFLGRFIASMGMVFVDRAERRQTARTVEEAVERLREGRSIVSFPEGTRTPDGRVHPFKTATFAAAMEAGVPVVPVALEGAARVLPRDGFRVRPGLVRVTIGEPIPTAGLGRQDRAALATRVQAAVAEMVEGMRLVPRLPG